MISPASIKQHTHRSLRKTEVDHFWKQKKEITCPVGLDLHMFSQWNNFLFNNFENCGIYRLSTDTLFLIACYKTSKFFKRPYIEYT